MTKQVHMAMTNARAMAEIAIPTRSGTGTPLRESSLGGSTIQKEKSTY